MLHFLQCDRTQSAPWWLRKAELDRLCLRGWRGDFFHAIDLLQLALRLRRLGRLGAKAIRESLERRDFLLLVFVSGKLLIFTRGLLLHVAVPIPPVTQQLRLRDFHDAADELIQEFPVVRNDQYCARIIS